MEEEEKGKGTRLPLAPAGTVLALGFGSQLSQVVLVRELLMLFHGNELTIGIVLAAWLGWVGAGSRIGAALARRTAHPFRAASVCAGGLLVVLPALLIPIRSARAFLGGVPGAWLSVQDTLWITVPALMPVGLLWGAAFVFLARLWRERMGQNPYPAKRASRRGAPDEEGLRSGTDLGGQPAREIRGGINTYAVEAIGNALGGLVFSLFFAQVLNAFACVALAGILFAAALAGWAAPRTRTRRIMASLAACAALALPFYGRLDAWAYRRAWQRQAPKQSLLETYPSRYGLISVSRLNGQYGFYQSGHRVFTSGTPDAPTPFEEQEAAILAHMAMAQNPGVERILLIGGGFRGTLAALTAHPIHALDYIELDPVLVQAARKRATPDTGAALNDPRVRLHTTDGRAFVKTADARYDLILVDMPDPATAVLNRYYTREFFAEAKQRLNPGGVLAIGATSTAGLRDSGAANRNATLYHTLRSVFPRVLPIGDRSLVFFASGTDARLTADASVLRDRHRTADIETPGFSDRLFLTLLQEEPLRRVNWILRQHGRTPNAALAPPETGPLFPPSLDEQERTEADLPPADPRAFINSDFRPIAYYYTLIFWSRHARGEPDRILPALQRIRPVWVAPFLGIALLAAALLRVAGRGTVTATARHYAVGFAVLTTGLSTMASQVALLFAFQSQYGYIYQMIGAIVAVFMGGLALGAHGFRPRHASFPRLAVLQGWIALWSVFMAFGLPAAARLAHPHAIAIVFMAIAFGAGVWNGMNFPLSFACTRSSGVETDSGLGRIYGWELLGACLGAVLAGVVVIPVWGIPACLLLAAALNAVAGGVIVCCTISLRSQPQRATG